MKKHITALCGSRLFGLDTGDSDLDYFAVVSGAGTAGLDPDVQTKISGDGHDLFVQRLDGFLDIRNCASVLAVPSYDAAVEYESEDLAGFWSGHASGLADIFPWATYRSAMDQVEAYLENGFDPTYKSSTRMLGFIWCRYYTGDMLSARRLPDFWRERYFKARRGEVDKSRITAWLASVQTPSFQRYFRNQPENRALHDQYKTILETIMTREEEAN